MCQSDQTQLAQHSIRGSEFLLEGLARNAGSGQCGMEKEECRIIGDVLCAGVPAFCAQAAATAGALAAGPIP